MPSQGANPSLPWREWRVLVLLVLSGLLNYIDRSNLSIGATNIQAELHLSNYQLGILLSAFFWTYALAQLCYVAGWLVDRWNVCWILAGGVALWSMATAVSGLAHSFTLLFGLRLLLGAGESIAYPSYSRILVTCFPEHHRGFSNAAIDAGTKLGPAVGALIGGLLIVSIGWRPFFIVLGAASFLWLFPWIAWMPRTKQLSAGGAAESTGILDVLRQRKLWWTALGLFCSNYFWYFLITWLPSYLEKERNFPKARMAVFSSLAYLAIAVSSVTAGRLSDFWIASGGSGHPSAHDVRGRRPRFLICAFIGPNHRRRGCRDGAPNLCLHLLRNVHVERVCDYADLGRTRSSRPLDQRAERHRQSSRRRRAVVYRLGSRPERPLLPRLPGRDGRRLISAAAFVFGVRRLDPVNWKSRA